MVSRQSAEIASDPKSANAIPDCALSACSRIPGFRLCSRKRSEASPIPATPSLAGATVTGRAARASGFRLPPESGLDNGRGGSAEAHGRGGSAAEGGFRLAHLRDHPTSPADSGAAATTGPAAPAVPAAELCGRCHAERLEQRGCGGKSKVDMGEQRGHGCQVTNVDVGAVDSDAEQATRIQSVSTGAGAAQLGPPGGRPLSSFG